jgi:PAS domain S-box-containing protein
LKHTPIDFKNIFEAMPEHSALVDAFSDEFTIIAVTDKYVIVSGLSREELIGKGLFHNFPPNPDSSQSSGEKALRASFKTCIAEKRISKLEIQRYDIPNQYGTFEEKYWNITNKPIFENNELKYILHTVEDVTELVLSQKKNEQVKHMEQAHNLFMQASVAIHIFKGPDLIIELANEPTLELWGKERDIIGKPLLQVLPEMESQGFIEIIHDVRITGAPYQEYETPIMLHKKGQDEFGYYNFLMQPYYEDDKKNAVGVLVIVTDVTDKIIGRNELIEKEKNLEIAINAKIETQNELEKTALKLRSFVESAPFPIGVYIGKEMRIEFVNQSILDVWGRKDVVGKLYSEVLPELESQSIYPQLEAVFTTGKAFHAKNQRIDLVHNEELKTFYFNYSFTPLFDSFGNIYGVMNTAADVTELNIAMQKIEESEYRYRTLIEESSVAAALYRGKDLTLQYANDIMLNYWGRDATIIGKTFNDALPELQDQDFAKLLAKVYETGIEYNGVEERATILVEGKLQEFYYNFTYKPLRNHLGKVYGIHHMAVDVTNEVLVKKELEKSENNFRSMILQAPIAICIFRGKDYIFEVINSMMEEMLGRSASLLIGKPFFEAMPEMRNDGLKPILDNIMTNGNSYKSEDQEFHLPDGDSTKTIYASYIYEPIKDSFGNVQSIIVVSTDVTQQVYARRKIEEIVAERTKALAEANKNLKESNAELEQFAYIASHDLQEPLRKISIFGKMLEESLENVSDRSLNYMNKINHSTQRMSNLIKDILGYSQLSKDSEVFRKVDLNTSLKGIISDYELIIEQKNVSLHWSHLPIIEAIPLQISQLLSNLISNSIKYSRDGISPEITITAENATPDDVIKHKLPNPNIAYTKITFIDNGIGFKEEYADRIFNIFQRLHGKTDYEGTGIGLAMCKKIAQNHHGTIFAEGSDSFGAKFVLILPINQVK